MPASDLASADMPDSTSRTLIDRVRAWDAEAWQRFVALYGPLVQHWVRRAQVQPADIDDIVQDVFRAVATGIHNFRRDRPGDRFRAWLRTIAANKVRDHFRKQARQPMAQGGSQHQERLLQQTENWMESEDEDERQAVSQVYVRAVTLLKSEFAEHTWQAFWLTVVQQQTTAEAASALGMTPAAVLKAKSRVRQRLQKEFNLLLE